MHITLELDFTMVAMRRLVTWTFGSMLAALIVAACAQPEATATPSSPSEKHGWRVLGGMMGPVQ